MSATTVHAPLAVAPPRILTGVNAGSLAVGIGVIAVAATLYLLTAARDIFVGDSPEFVTVAVTLGVAHPPGYPLLTMLGHLFSLLPLEPVAFRVNLLSVVCDALTVGLICATALRLTRDRAASALAALLLAVNPLFWRWSLVIETFPLNNLLAATLVYLLVVWQQRPERAAPLIAAAFVGGLGMSNHQTIVLLIPAVLYCLWRQRAVLFARPWILGACAAASLAGLIPYAYLPWAASHHPPMSWGNIASFNDLVSLFLRRDYGTGQLVSSPGYQGGSVVQRIAALLDSFGPLDGALLAVGAVYAYRRVRWYFWLSALAFVFSGPLFVAYSNVNLSISIILFVLERFFLLSHVVTAPLMAFGVLALLELAEGARQRWKFAPRAAIGVLAIAVIAGAVTTYAAVDQSRNHVARWFGEDVLASVEPNAILLAGGDETVLPIEYLQTIERDRPDVTLVMLGLLPADWYIRQLKERHPDLVVPFDHFDGRQGTTLALVAANPRRPIDVVWGAPDDSLKTSYWYYSRGLVLRLLPMSEDVTLQEMTAENERLLASYRLPSLPGIKQNTFERAILYQYGMAPYRVGEEFEHANMPSGARTWYERALSIDPELPKALWRLSQLPRQ